MFVEGLRTDSLYLPFTIGDYEPRVSQLLSAALVVAGIVLLIVFRKKDDKIKEQVNISENKDVSQEEENV